MNAGRFDLTGKVCIITGGGGLLGCQHAAAIAEAGGIPVSWDIVLSDAPNARRVDVTNNKDLPAAAREVLDTFGRIDILINNAAIDSREGAECAFERYELGDWECELDVGLTGAFLCSQVIGGWMAANGGGVIVNVGSDFAHLAPNPKDYAPRVKPASYSVVKHGLLGLTRYLAAYWAEKNVRVNMLSPGGVENGQAQEFIDRIAAHVPLGRMARADEYKGALQFLCSEASAYMTGGELIIDGGRHIL